MAESERNRHAETWAVMSETNQDEWIVALINRNIDLQQRVHVLEEIIAAISKKSEQETQLRWIYYRKMREMQDLCPE